MFRTALYAAFVTLAGLAPGAGAATVALTYETVSEPKTTPYRLATLVLTAAPGEANDVTLSSVRGELASVVVVRDAGAPLTPGEGCRADGDGSVRCQPQDAGLKEVRALLGDGADRLSGPDLVVVVAADGGAGDDVVVGSPMGDRLDGGEGADRVEGAGGNDELQGGLGADDLAGGFDDDRMQGDPAAGPLFSADRMDGGDGDRDLLTYENRTTPVTVDLGDPAGDGAPGEQDAVSGFELLTGGAAGDVLAGGAQGDTIRGADGDDRLAGGPGVDELHGEAGRDALRGGTSRDVLRGGRGNDRLEGEAGDDELHGDEGADEMLGGTSSDVLDARDSELFAGGSTEVDPVLDCGAGPGDRVYLPNARERVRRGCEAVGIMRSLDPDPTANVSNLPRRRRGRLILRSSCRVEARCTGRAVVRDTTGRLLASGTGGGYEGFDIRLRPTPAGRRVLRGAFPALRITVRVTAYRVPATVSFVSDAEG